MKRLAIALLVVVLTGCSTPPPLHPGPSVRELAGTWRGRLAIGAANGVATLAIKEDGTYAGMLHLEGGDRPFSGAIVQARPGRLRYLGTNGDGTVVVTPPNQPAATLHFVPDGGGGGGSLARGK
jgi:hypothetical protein